MMESIRLELVNSLMKQLIEIEKGRNIGEELIGRINTLTERDGSIMSSRWGVYPDGREVSYAQAIKDWRDSTPWTQVDANRRQVGGTHYHQPIQHWDFVLANGIPYLEAQVIKYVMRHGKKGGAQDLEKAKHFIDKLIEEHYANQPMQGYVNQ